MTLIQTIYCPTCGDEMFEIDYDDPSTLNEVGRACPNKCGWITVEQQGEELAVKVGIASY